MNRRKLIFLGIALIILILPILYFLNSKFSADDTGQESFLTTPIFQDTSFTVSSEEPVKDKELIYVKKDQMYSDQEIRDALAKQEYDQEGNSTNPIVQDIEGKIKSEAERRTTEKEKKNRFVDYVTGVVGDDNKLITTLTPAELSRAGSEKTNNLVDKAKAEETADVPLLFNANFPKWLADYAMEAYPKIVEIIGPPSQMRPISFRLNNDGFCYYNESANEVIIYRPLILDRAWFDSARYAVVHEMTHAFNLGGPNAFSTAYAEGVAETVAGILWPALASNQMRGMAAGATVLESNSMYSVINNVMHDTLFWNRYELPPAYLGKMYIEDKLAFKKYIQSTYNAPELQEIVYECSDNYCYPVGKIRYSKLFELMQKAYSKVEDTPFDQWFAKTTIGTPENEILDGGFMVQSSGGGIFFGFEDLLIYTSNKEFDYDHAEMLSNSGEKLAGWSSQEIPLNEPDFISSDLADYNGLLKIRFIKNQPDGSKNIKTIYNYQLKKEIVDHGIAGLVVGPGDIAEISKINDDGSVGATEREIIVNGGFSSLSDMTIGGGKFKILIYKTGTDGASELVKTQYVNVPNYQSYYVAKFMTSTDDTCNPVVEATRRTNDSGKDDISLKVRTDTFCGTVLELNNIVYERAWAKEVTYTLNNLPSDEYYHYKIYYSDDTSATKIKEGNVRPLILVNEKFENLKKWKNGITYSSSNAGLRNGFLGIVLSGDNSALKIQKNNADNIYAYQSFIPVKGKKYALTADFKMTDFTASDQLAVGFINATKNERYLHYQIASNQDWQKIYNEVIIPDNEIEDRWVVYISGSKLSGGSVYLDNVLLQELSDLTEGPILKNGKFEDLASMDFQLSVDYGRLNFRERNGIAEFTDCGQVYSRCLRLQKNNATSVYGYQWTVLKPNTKYQLRADYFIRGDRAADQVLLRANQLESNKDFTVWAPKAATWSTAELVFDTGSDLHKQWRIFLGGNKVLGGDVLFDNVTLTEIK